MSGDYIGIEAVVDYFRRVRRETAGTLQVEPAEISRHRVRVRHGHRRDSDVTQSWLVIGYVLAAFILVNAFGYHVPTAKKLEVLAAASSDDEPSAELRAFVDAPIGRVVNVIDGLLWLALIYVMVAKPFS